MCDYTQSSFFSAAVLSEELDGCVDGEEFEAPATASNDAAVELPATGCENEVLLVAADPDGNEVPKEDCTEALLLVNKDDADVLDILELGNVALLIVLEIVVAGCLAADEADDCCPAVPLGAAAGLAALGVAVCCCLLLRWLGGALLNTIRYPIKNINKDIKYISP